MDEGPVGFGEEWWSSPELASYLMSLRRYTGLNGRPVLAVLDSSCVRTGLQYQLKWGEPPRSVRDAQDHSMRLFMEHETLEETKELLPKFAEGLGAPVEELMRILNVDWLPHIDIVKLPEWLRALDPRAVEVKERDADDYLPRP
jgi:hypothetical protein